MQFEYNGHYIIRGFPTIHFIQHSLNAVAAFAVLFLFLFCLLCSREYQMTPHSSPLPPLLLVTLIAGSLLNHALIFYFLVNACPRLEYFHASVCGHSVITHHNHNHKGINYYLFPEVFYRVMFPLSWVGHNCILKCLTFYDLRSNSQIYLLHCSV